MAPRFLYFDFGKVLVSFDHHIACRQMAAVAGLSQADVQRLVFDSGFQLAFERGDFSSQEFYEEFCRRSRTAPERDELLHAASAIFEPQPEVLELVSRLRDRGYRLGVLSNTCDIHWQYCSTGRFASLPSLFEVLALSYQLRLLKPQAEIYWAAARLAGVAPTEVFFVDDRLDNIAGAQAAGFDAVQFTTVAALVQELERRGVSLN